MCIAFSEVSEDEGVRRQTWVKERLATISSQLLKAREVLKETPPTTPAKAPVRWRYALFLHELME